MGPGHRELSDAVEAWTRPLGLMRLLDGNYNGVSQIEITCLVGEGWLLAGNYCGGDGTGGQEVLRCRRFASHSGVE